VLDFASIKWVHIEPSTKCNAWCPACPRNKNGFGLADDLIEEDLSADRVEEILSQLPNLYAVQLCGNYGDPIAGHNILDIIDVVKKYSSKIQIHTNGSLRNKTWWSDLATVLSTIDHDVWFGIDGIGDVHEIYRQGTSYDKIIDNATSFISSGGYATWQFIPYAHNEHQIRDALKNSQKLGFKKFKLAKLYRDKKLARHYQTGEEFLLLPPKEVQSLMRMPKDFLLVKNEDCMHLTQPSVYLSANGKLSYCCYFNKTKTFDNLNELLLDPSDLTHPKCLFSCGS
jgi:MoaA/NifB/PqqE/SkfB family radical SAM enzyme